MILLFTSGKDAGEMEGQDRRQEARYSTSDKVRITIGGIEAEGAMRNLSQAGCMIECGDLEAEVGQMCEIDLRPGFAASGRIAWQLGNALGISFHQPVPKGIVRDYALDDWLLRRA